MKPKISLICLLAVSAISNASIAAPIQWPSTSGGNDHWYEILPAPSGGIDWTDAQAQATSLGGYLATLLSGAENQFVFDNLVNNPSFWTNNTSPGFEFQLVGPWVGGFQPDSSPEPSGGWEWVNSDGTFAAAGYSNWDTSEPNNFGGQEDRTIFYNNGASSILNSWNDVSVAGMAPSFVVEYTTIPEPSSLIILGLGVCCLAATQRRRVDS